MAEPALDDDFDNTPAGLLKLAKADPEAFKDDPEMLELLEEYAGDVEYDDEGGEDTTGDADAGDGDEDPSDGGEGDGEEDADEGEEEADKADAEPDEGEGSEGDEGDKAPGVLTKDGKHFLPYETLQAERSKAAALKAERDELQARLDAASQGSGDDNTPEADTETEDVSAALTDEKIAEAEEAYGSEVAASMRATRALARELKEVRAALSKQENASQQDEISQLQADIDAVPELAAVEVGSPMWDAAAALDGRYEIMDEWKGRSRVDRLRQVAKDLNLATPDAVPDKPPPKAAKASKNSTQAQRKATEAEAQAEKDAPPPSSMQSLGAGDQAESTSKPDITTMTPDELNTYFESLSPEEMERQIAGAYE